MARLREELSSEASAPNTITAGPAPCALPSPSVAGPSRPRSHIEACDPWIEDRPGELESDEPDEPLLDFSILSSNAPIYRGVHQTPHGQATLMILVDGLLNDALSTYFDRFHELRPIVDKESVIVRFALRDHLYDEVFGGLILSLAALALVASPGYQKQEQQANELVAVALRLHSAPGLGETPRLESIATSMSIAAFVGATKGRQAAYVRSREAVALAELLRLDSPNHYDQFTTSEKRIAINIFWALSAAERSGSLFEPRSITIRGRPSQVVSSLGSSVVDLTLTPLNAIIRIYDIVDEDILDCLNGLCKGRHCHFDSSRAVVSLHALDSVELYQTLNNVQIADFMITRLWLKVRIWQTCVTHSILSSTIPLSELSMTYPLDILAQAHRAVSSLPAASFEGNGRAMVRRRNESSRSSVGPQTIHHCNNRDFGPSAAEPRLSDIMDGRCSRHGLLFASSSGGVDW